MYSYTDLSISSSVFLEGIFNIDIFTRTTNIQHAWNSQLRVLTLLGQDRLEVPQTTGDEGRVERRETVVVVPAHKHLHHPLPGWLRVHHVLGDPSQLGAERGDARYSNWLDVLVELADNSEGFRVHHQTGKLDDLLWNNLFSPQTVCFKVQNQKVFKFLFPAEAMEIINQKSSAFQATGTLLSL